MSNNSVISSRVFCCFPSLKYSFSQQQKTPPELRRSAVLRQGGLAFTRSITSMLWLPSVLVNMHGERSGVSDRARCLFISERGSRERAPPGRGRWASVWRGGLGSATSRGIDRIKLDLSEINTKERRATHRSPRGRRCETRRTNIPWEENLNFSLLSLFIFQTKKGPRWIFFPSQRRY